MGASTMARFVGIYLDGNVIRRDPGYLDALQAGIGLTNVTVMAPSRVSAGLLARNPLGGDRAARLRELSACRLDGVPYVGEPDVDGPQVAPLPGVDHSDDDSALREAIALCRQR